MTEAKNTELAKKIDDGGSKALKQTDKEFWPAVLDNQIEAFANALAGTNVDPKHYARVALTALRANPTLAGADFVGVMSAIMAAAQLGLEPHGPLGEAYLIPFKNTKENRVDTTLIVGYQGFITLAYRSGRVQSIISHAVYANDEFDYELGTNERIVHRPVHADRGEMIGAYAIAKLAGGGEVFEFMTTEQIHERRARSKSKDSGPWKTDYEAMCRKTVIRQLFKWLPKSVEISTALSADEQSFKQIPTSKEDVAEFIDIEELEEV